MIGLVHCQRRDGDVTVKGAVCIQSQIASVDPDGLACGTVQIVAHMGKIVGIIGAALAGDPDLAGIAGDIDVVNTLYVQKSVFPQE